MHMHVYVLLIVFHELNGCLHIYTISPEEPFKIEPLLFKYSVLFKIAFVK